jgi:hypothetical protein
MIEKKILCVERLRRVPVQFSWIDGRLVRYRYVQRAPVKAWALYLVLVTVGDEHGLSYYSDSTLAEMLAVRVDEIITAREQLVAAGVVAYEAPLYQVLALEAPVRSATKGGAS